MRVLRSPMEKLYRIGEIVRDLDARMAGIYESDHIPRTTPLAPGVPATPFNECDPQCPACALARKYGKHRVKLSSIERTALSQLARDVDLKQTLRKIKNQANASKPRKVGLARRGFECVLEEHPEATAEKIRDWLKMESLTYDYADIELSIEGDDIIVTDLKSMKTKIVQKSNQVRALKNAATVSDR